MRRSIGSCMGRLFNQRRRRGVKSTLFILFCCQNFCETVSIRQITPEIAFFHLPTHCGTIPPLCFELPYKLLSTMVFQIEPTFNRTLSIHTQEEHFSTQLLKGIKFWQYISK